LKPDSTRLFLVDAAAVGLVSILICTAGQRLAVMTAAVLLVLLGRLALAAWLAPADGLSLTGETLFFLICLVLGAFNDWNSVCNHKIYDYTVPSDLAWSTIPLWMLLSWGLILRSFARLCRWQALAPPAAPSNTIHLGFATLENSWVKIGTELALVLLTRQTIYRLYLDPVLSWLPFAAALLLGAWLWRPSRHDLKILAFLAVAGPGAEILYINVGRLHRYHLGWIGGVPLWIVLWWLLAAIIGKDLFLRLQASLEKSPLSKTGVS
jgi:hypothetical protein